MNARIVFDLDGTLIDSAPDIRSIANASLSKIDVAPITLEETHSFIGEGVCEAWVLALAFAGTRKTRTLRRASNRKNSEVLFPTRAHTFRSL